MVFDLPTCVGNSPCFVVISRNHLAEKERESGVRFAPMCRAMFGPCFLVLSGNHLAEKERESGVRFAPMCRAVFGPC